MKPRASLRMVLVVLALCVVFLGVQALLADVHAASGKKCPRGVQPCNANQVGQPCNPNNLNIICSAQSNGSYCCLAYAP